MRIIKQLKPNAMIIKNIITSLALIYCSLSIGQSTITVEQAGYYIYNEIPFPQEVNRVMDTNNSLTPFVGRWTGVFNGKTYFFEISESTTSNRYSGVTSDNLVISYNISDGSGNVLFSSSSNTYSEIQGRFMSPRNHYYSTLADPCGNHSDVIIMADYTVPPSSTILTVDTVFDKILVYIYTVKELLNMEPANCVSISNQFPDRTLFVLDKI